MPGMTLSGRPRAMKLPKRLDRAIARKVRR
jgi:hypothetical protein